MRNGEMRELTDLDRMLIMAKETLLTRVSREICYLVRFRNNRGKARRALSSTLYIQLPLVNVSHRSNLPRY